MGEEMKTYITSYNHEFVVVAEKIHCIRVDRDEGRYCLDVITENGTHRMVSGMTESVAKVLLMSFRNLLQMQTRDINIHELCKFAKKNVGGEKTVEEIFPDGLNGFEVMQRLMNQIEGFDEEGEPEDEMVDENTAQEIRDMMGEEEYPPSPEKENNTEESDVAEGLPEL